MVNYIDDNIISITTRVCHVPEAETETDIQIQSPALDAVSSTGILGRISRTDMEINILGVPSTGNPL